MFSFSKAIDTFCPIGPWIVTEDDVPDAQALAMELRVNGGVRQRGNTAQMLIAIPHLVAYHSAQGYSAGDILTTGTISGVAAVQPNPFEFYLQPGDSIEAEIQGVGVLRNHVVPWSAAHAMLPTLGLGANLALRDAAHLLDQLSAAARGDEPLIPAIGRYEQGMRDYVYPFMRMTMDHDRQFGGGALAGRDQPAEHPR